MEGSVGKCSSCTGDPSSSKYQSFEAAIGLQGQGYPLPGRGCEAQIWKEEVEHLEPVMACNRLSSADRESVEPCCVFCFIYKFAAHLLEKFIIQPTSPNLGHRVGCNVGLLNRLHSSLSWLTKDIMPFIDWSRRLCCSMPLPEYCKWQDDTTR